MSPQKIKRSEKNTYQHVLPIKTRWKDNDIYGHVNNAIYYSYFDTAVNDFLIGRAGLDIHEGKIIAYVVASQCAYHRPISFPETIHVGLRVSQLGKSSVEYQLAIFRESDTLAAADGQFVHVFVDRESNKPVAIPGSIRTALDSLTVSS